VSAYFPPLRCVYAAACIGAVSVSDLDGSSVVSLPFDNAGNDDALLSSLTQRCAEGYDGTQCVDCAIGCT
jgi:hypothetical protein